MASSASNPPPAPAAEPASPPTEAVRARGFWNKDLGAVLRDTYGTLDRRTLGFTRLLLGFYLIMDLFRRTDAWLDMFSLEGVLPNNVILWRPQSSAAWSLLHGFSTAPELWALWAVILATYVCLFLGYKTKVAQVLAVVFVTSMNGRVLLIENGGYVVQNLLVMWTAFLPLGDRFSLDSMLRSMRGVREVTEGDLNDRDSLDDDDRPNRYHTFMGFALVCQLSAIYYFNVIHKTGPAWKNGTAVHYVLYVDRMATPLIAHLRDYVPNWMILFMTKATLAFEASIPVCLFSPLGRKWARRIAIGMINTLHIAFGTTFVLGPFAWAACTFSTLLFSTDDWEVAYRTMRRTHRARTVLYDPASAAAFHACRVLKRCDNFELLRFRATPGVAGGLAVIGPSGERVVGALALSEVVAALPVGPVVAWALRLPVLRSLFDALAGLWLRPRTERFFGLTLPKAAAMVFAPLPSAIARGRRRFVATLRELAILVMFASAVNQALTELWVVNRRVRVPHPEPLKSLAHKLRFLQGWFMFSPNPVMDDGTIVVDAITVDGRHIDPFWGKEPNFDLLNAKSMSYDQIWSDYFNRMHLPANSAYRDAMRDYMLRLPERTGRPEDAIVSGDVYWVQDMNPKWNDTKSYQPDRKKLFSFENRELKAKAAEAQAAAPDATSSRRIRVPFEKKEPGEGEPAAPSVEPAEVPPPTVGDENGDAKNQN